MLGAELGQGAGARWGTACGVIVGAFFVLPSLATNYLFEGKPFLVTAINGGYHVVRFALHGAGDWAAWHEDGKSATAKG